jgi:hypothetical protein
MRPVWILSLLSVALVGAGCDRNCAVGNPRDALVDGRRDSMMPREAGADGRRDGSPGVGWAVSAGGDDYDLAGRMVVDGSDNIIVAGYIGKSARFGAIGVTSAGSAGVFVAKLDHSGTFLWAVPLPGFTQSGLGNGLAVDGAGNILYAGMFTGTVSFGSTTLTAKGSQDGFLAKLDPNGNLLWARAVVASPGLNSVQSVALAGNGQITIGGDFSDTATFGGSSSLMARGKSDLYVARLDGAGNLLWVTQGGSDSAYTEGVNRLVLDSAGNIVVAGAAGEDATFGSFSRAGTPGSISAFVAKLDASGTFVWVAGPPGTWPGSSSEQRGLVDALKLDSAGNIFVATTISVPRGLPNPVGQAMISKLSSSGAVLWSTPATGDGNTGVNSLLVGGNGSVTAGGFFTGTAALLGTTMLQSRNANPSYGTGFLARLDASGAFVHAEQLDGTQGGASIMQLARDSSANLYACGCYGGIARFGGTTLTSNGPGLVDMFVWNMGPEQY